MSRGTDLTSNDCWALILKENSCVAEYQGASMSEHKVEQLIKKQQNSRSEERRNSEIGSTEILTVLEQTSLCLCQNDLKQKPNEISFDENDEFNFLKSSRLPRSSSLKSGTPSRRKSVRFADALGLDLELVRHILNSDEPPTVPVNAFQRLKLETPEQSIVVSYWRACFSQPIICENIVHRVLENKVLLENCTINNSNRKVYGIIRVANIAYQKEVSVRFTVNGWITYEDVRASYIEHSNDLITDRFSFHLQIPEHLGTRSRLEFAVLFSVGDESFCDNNFNRNYALECVEYHKL